MLDAALDGMRYDRAIRRSVIQFVEWNASRVPAWLVRNFRVFNEPVVRKQKVSSKVIKYLDNDEDEVKFWGLLRL